MCVFFNLCVVGWCICVYTGWRCQCSYPAQCLHSYSIQEVDYTQVQDDDPRQRRVKLIIHLNYCNVLHVWLLLLLLHLLDSRLHADVLFGYSAQHLASSPNRRMLSFAVSPVLGVAAWQLPLQPSSETSLFWHLVSSLQTGSCWF